MSSKTKVVGIGLNKTGTTTLGHCFRHWGFKHNKFDRLGFDFWKQGNLNSLLDRMVEFDSFEDWPWPLCFKEIDNQFPGTKFILTKRMNAETWFQSLCQHAQRTGPTEFRRLVFGFAMPEAHAQEHIEFYENHNALVREYFKDRPGDLLEVCWENGDSWPVLATFLNQSIPGVPFPHANKSPAKLKT